MIIFISPAVCNSQTDAPKKTVVMPYKRPTPQEICFKRMQIAQQQAAQLSAAVKAAPQTSNPGVSREKKRIAHRPNPQTTPSKTSTSASQFQLSSSEANVTSYMCVFVRAGPALDKAAASGVVSSSKSLQGVRTQTTAGILSKTSSTVTQKRVAHTPTMKVFKTSHLSF